MMGEPAHALLQPISVLDVMEATGVTPQVGDYTMSMKGLAATSQIEAGFALLVRAEASGLLCHSNNDPYPMFHTLLQACHLVGDSCGASQVQAAVDRLGLVTPIAAATASITLHGVHS